MGWQERSAALALLLAGFMLASSASKINTSYLLPGKEFKVVPTASGEIPRFCALTFDDGPDAKYTLKVLAVLKKEGVHATFFCIGRHVQDYPEQVRQMLADGHEVGNHSWSHPDFTKLSAKQQRSEMDRCSAELAKCGVTVHWFRPPYGAFTKTTMSQAKDADMIPLLWSVDPRDWSEPGAAVIQNRVLSHIGNGAVVLLHSTHGQTVEALPGLIEALRKEGYSFVTLSEWQALVTGQQLPVPVSPGLPAELENIPPNAGQGGDSLPSIGGDDATTELPMTPGLVRAAPFFLRPLGTEIKNALAPAATAPDAAAAPAAPSSPGADSPAAAAPAPGTEANAPESGPYQIDGSSAPLPVDSQGSQFAAPPSLSEVVGGADNDLLSILAQPAPASIAVPPAPSTPDAAGRATVSMVEQLAGRLWEFQASSGADRTGLLEWMKIVAPEPLKIHANFHDPDELDRLLH